MIIRVNQEINVHFVGLYYANKGHDSLDRIVPPITLCILSFYTLHSKGILWYLKFENFACKETLLFELKEAENYSDVNKTATLIGPYFISTNITQMASVAQSI